MVSTNNQEIPDNHEGETNNPLYYPLIDNTGDWFSERNFDIHLTQNNGPPTLLSSEKINILKKKLTNFEDIKPNEIKMVVNRNVALNNLIDNPADEINEGSKIIKWIDAVLKKEIFTDLNLSMHKGYVWITRNGIDVIDKITDKLSPNLVHFDWQINKPINYQILKHVVLQNKFQSNIPVNREQKIEAERIMSQEYLIALQPAPRYQLWVIKKLIMAWYGNEKLEKNIRKIKVLINQYRSDPTKEHNKKHGIYPSILIYPKYGIEALKSVMPFLNYYFSMYVDENSYFKNDDLQWIDSHPEHFIKQNSLIYYSNGSMDLKKYIQKSTDNSNELENNVFNKDYTELEQSGKVMAI